MSPDVTDVPVATDVTVAPPHGIELEQHARIAAHLAEGTSPQAKVFESFRITEKQWNESTAYWMSALADDAQKNAANARLPIQYSNAYSEAQDALAPVPQMTPEQWAELTVEIQNEGGPGQPLARRNLSLADYLRLARHFAKRLSSDPAEQQKFFDRYLALQPE